MRRATHLVGDLENEREVIGRCRAGDLRAFEIIYRRFEQPLLRVGRRMLGHPQDAEDAVQMAFLKLYRNIDKFQFESRFSTYLFRIMLNICFDAIRKRQAGRRRPAVKPAVAAHPDVDIRLQVDEAIRMLPERMRACFVLFAVEEMKQSEIADLLNMRLGTVKAHIFQAKSRLRELLADLPREVIS